MGLPNSKTKKVSGLTVIEPNTDSTSLLVMGGVAVAAGTGITALPLGTVVELRSTADANSYGLNDAYDIANKVLVYHHIERFFLRMPTAKLYIMLFAQPATMTAATSMTNVCDLANAYLAKALQLKGGEIKQAGVVLNPDMGASYPETVTTSLNDDVVTAIAKAQALATAEYLAFRPVDIILEGRAFTGSSTAAIDLRTKGAGQVAVVIGADYDISSTGVTVSGTTTHPFAKYAAVGDFLGTVAAAKVNQSPGSVRDFNLTDTGTGSWITAGLSSGTQIKTDSVINYSDATLDALYDKGYIFGRYIAGHDGIYWGGYPTCQAITADDCYGERSRTLNKASRLLRAAWIDSINGEVTLDPTDGTIIATQAAKLEADAEQYINDRMLANREISSPVIVSIVQKDIDGNPISFLDSSETINYQAQIPIKGVIRQISGSVQLVDSVTQ